MKKSILFLLACLAVGCSDGKETQLPPDGTQFTRNFIQTYLLPTKLMAQHVGAQGILVTFDGDRLSNRDQAVRPEYEALSNRYQDSSFNNRLVPNTITALGEDLSAIYVVCDKAVDDSHAAGTLLNDMIQIYAVSFDEFIQAGYTREDDAPAVPAEFTRLGLYGGIGSYPLVKLLNEASSDDLRLIEPIVYLRFTKPLPAGEYTFTVTAVSEERNLSGSVVLPVA